MCHKVFFFFFLMQNVLVGFVTVCHCHLNEKLHNLLRVLRHSRKYLISFAFLDLSQQLHHQPAFVQSSVRRILGQILAYKHIRVLHARYPSLVNTGPPTLGAVNVRVWASWYSIVRKITAQKTYDKIGSDMDRRCRVMPIKTFCYLWELDWL